MSERTDTSRSGDLVERLRERTCVVFNSPGVHPDTECLEAADRIEALEAENARLREALGRIAYGDRWTDPDSPQRIAKDALTALERIDND